MNSLLAQFVTEARELLDAAVGGLLRMERGDGDDEVVNTVFRAVHTLKGTSGLFEVAPLTRLVHAGEDLLDSVRSGRLALHPGMVDLLLGALDQTRNWIDDLERDETLPEDAERVAGEHATRLRALLGNTNPQEATGEVPAAAMAGPPPWVADLPAAGRLAAEQMARAADCDMVAIDYRPDSGCFFRGEDPLQLVRQVPELAMLHMGHPTPWPPLDGFDPLECVVSFQMLSTAPVEELRHLFRYSDETQIAAYAAPARTAPDWIVVGEILEAQAQLLALPCTPDAARGRANSVAEVLRRATRHCDGPPLDESALASAVEQAGSGDPAALLAFVRSLTPPNAAADSTEDAESSKAAPNSEPRATGPTTTLRVEQSRIDALMNLIGELIVAKNSLSYLARKAEAGASARELARDIKDQQAVVNRLAEDMQSAIMAIRMLPVSHVFQRFPRVVRDISRKLDKQVALEFAGEETEADKNMIEALADPLMHMVRNSLDHGLETPAERIAAGKPPQGTIRLAAEQANESIIVTIRDDGRGIDPARMRVKAVERGMMDAAAAAALPDGDALRLVFAPGFSTAEQVSDLSGRGVGMDVVRSTVERAGGRVDLDSRLGEGTTVRVTLPLTMAVTRIMTIECAGHLFGIPMNAVVESVRLAASAVKRIRGCDAFVLREQVVPLLRLAQLLELPADAAAGARPEMPVLVLRAGQATVGLVIDGFRERMEAIVRPLEGVLAGLRCFVGTTLLGDGRVLLILNVAEFV